MIPFHIPKKTKSQQAYVLQAMQAPALQGDGVFSKKVVELLSDRLGVDRILLTPSASHALELAFFSLDAEDEVIIPAYNFPSAPNAVLRGGGKVTLCDIDIKTQNICPDAIIKHITPHTKAIAITHYAGVACDMERIRDIANAHHILLVEDAAQAIGSYYMQTPLGAFGDCACLSFHSSKNITCGEGGAYLQSGDSLDFSLMRMRREKGTNRHMFVQERDRFYYWETLGTSHLMPEISAAFLLAQLEELESINAKRREICALYDTLLTPLFLSERLIPMHIPSYALSNGHIYYIRCKDETDKLFIKAFMHDKGICCLPHFAPLHEGAMGKRLGYKKGDFPNSERTAQTLLRLPVYDGLSKRDIMYIADMLKLAVRQ